MADTTTGAALPLANMRVVSFCHYLQGPACSQYLADLGADVVKIEPPQGGLTKTSLAMCEQERSQSIDRFRRLKGTVTAETLHSVQRIVAELIDAYQLYR